MAKFNEEWKVGPHNALEELDTGLLTVAAEITMPLGNFPRRMTVVGLRDNRTAIWSAVPLREPEMQRIEALGEPTFLIVPGIGHRLDVSAWKKRYPQAKVVCAPGARKAVEEITPVDATTDILDDPEGELQVVPGVGEKESALLVKRDAGTTLVVNDILANVRHPHGIGAHIMARLLGFGVNKPQMPHVGKWMFVDDKKALAAGFRAWAQEPKLKRVIVSHGDVIGSNAKQVLEQMASDIE